MSYVSKYFKDSEVICRGNDCGHKPDDLTMQTIDKIRQDYGHALDCTSGARCDAYTAKLILQGTPAALKSKHISLCAADLKPTDMPIQHFHAWIETKLYQYNIWMEDPKSTKSWCHIQTQPFPGWHEGMSRIFKP